MEQERNVETGSGSFYGEYLYDQVVAKDHFLRKLQEVVDWGYFTRRLIKIYNPTGLIGMSGLLVGAVILLCKKPPSQPSSGSPSQR